MALIDKILSKLGASETKIKVFRNLYWAVLGKVVTLLGGLFVGILVARYLGPEQYGLMSYVISYVSLFHIFASLQPIIFQTSYSKHPKTGLNIRKRRFRLFLTRSSARFLHYIHTLPFCQEVFEKNCRFFSRLVMNTIYLHIII